MTFKFNHFNFNVTDLERSKAFYRDALGLEESHRIEADDGSYVIVYLSDGSSKFDGKTGFRLELTWLKDHPQQYDLGECEFHLAMTAANYPEAYKKHQEAGCVCFVNEEMGIYFIEDPDGYWIEILPPR